MKLKRIALVSHEMTYTGAPNSLLNIAVLLRQHGHNVSVFTLTGGDFVREFRNRHFTVKRIFENFFEYSSLSEYDLVIANTVFCLSFAVKAQRYANVVLYIREAHNLPELISANGLNDEYLNQADNIICVSEYAEEFIKKNYSVKRIFVLHNFLNRPLLHFPRKNVICGGKVRFLIAGTIEKRKGTVIAAEAIRLLPDSVRTEAELYVAGRKPEWSRDYWEAEDFSAYNIRYLGEIQSNYEMKKLYNTVNCVIVPSLDEACSLTALEGAMYGRALILSENVGAGYIINGNGMRVKTGSAEALSHAMHFIIRNKDQLGLMGENSYRQFCNTSLPGMYYRGFIEIIRKIKE